MAMNDSTPSSRQLSARWSSAIGVLKSASSVCRRLLHRGLRARVPLCRIPLTANHNRLRLLRAHKHRARQADWHQVVFSNESRFNLWDHEGRVRIRRYTGKRCLPECVFEWESGRIPTVMVWEVISYHDRSNLLRIEGTLIATGTSMKCCSPSATVVPFL